MSSADPGVIKVDKADGSNTKEADEDPRSPSPSPRIPSSHAKGEGQTRRRASNSPSASFSSSFRATARADATARQAGGTGTTTPLSAAAAAAAPNATARDTAASSTRLSLTSALDLEEPTRLSELKRFTLWETKTRFYLVAFNTSQTKFRILKVDRTPSFVTSTSEPQEHDFDHNGGGKRGGGGDASTFPGLNVTSDRVVYTRTQVQELLDMIAEGNKATGGLREVGRFFGIVGFIRFTSTYYMVLVSKRSVVALIGGHYIYHCDETKILPVCPPSLLATLGASGARTKAMDQEEARLLHTFRQVDLSKNFYFSYTYDLTNTLQENLTGPIAGSDDKMDGSASHTAWGFNEKFVWNHNLLLPAFRSSESGCSDQDDAASEWVLPLVYGFVDQAKLSVLHSTIHVTLIARRSRHFAGARFLKRGTDDQGHVANDVETEQIVSQALTTPFYAPSKEKKRATAKHQDCRGRRRRRSSASYEVEDDGEEENDRGSVRDGETPAYLGPNPRFTSYVMHRGSIPIYWTQDSTNMSPRPPIEISVVDPYYTSAALHFDDMFRRYGSPIIVLNLIKSKEKQPREVKLLHAFSECVSYLNQFLPLDKRLKYIAWDMSRASKSRDQDVIGVLEDIAEETVAATQFFHSGPEPNGLARSDLDSHEEGSDLHHRKKRRETILLQSGVARVNCVDCLDRTNAAQFVIGKAAFGHQLHALGLLTHPSLPFDSDAVDMLTEMYHDLGDTIALQYGGSHLVNTMETYRKINQWTSHSRDMLEGLKRYYANSFVDADKQAAINLFLGADSDSTAPLSSNTKKGGAAANSNACAMMIKQRRSYQQWFTPAYLETNVTLEERQRRLADLVMHDGNFWAEYYRPSLFTDLLRHHAFKMTAIHQHSSSGVGAGPLQHSLASSSPSFRHTRNAHSLGNASSSFSLGRTTTLSSADSDVSTYASSMNGMLPSSSQSVVLVSPFTSRLPSTGASSAMTVTSASPRAAHRQRASSMASSSRIPPSPSSTAAASTATPKAIIGGVRRWMSLNRAEGGSTLGQSPGATPRKRSRRMTSLSNADDLRALSSDDEQREDRIGTYGETMAASIAERETWPSWEEVTSAPSKISLNPSTRMLLKNHTKPSVSTDEAREYAWWLDQFKEVVFDGGGNSYNPESAEVVSQGLLSEPRTTTSSQMIHHGAVGQSQAAAIVASKSAPATHQQRQQIALADAELYESGIMTALGLNQSDFMSVGSHLSTEGESTVLGGIAPGVDPTLVSYIHGAAGSAAAQLSSMGAGPSGGASDAKTRAYTQWLLGPVNARARPQL